MSAVPELPSSAPATFWLDGGIVEPHAAKVPLTDHGLLYGDGVFEGIRICERRVFRLADHLRRFATGARAIGLEVPGGIAAAERAVLECARAHDADEAYLRLVATRGDGTLGVDPTLCPRARLFCIATQISVFSPEKMRTGLDMVTVSQRRAPLDALDPSVKSLNYMASVLAKREARMRGADEALMLNARGTVAEAAVANVFVVRDGRLLTPPPCDGGLRGITRDSVLSIATSQGVECAESSLGRFDLLGADEVFLTGTGARIVPVATLDGQRIGWEAPNAAPSRPLMSAIVRAFPAFARERGVAF